ncbi:uncharacterized protein LOC131051900 [Cryptomeria japonica]|uniref:uncharacterized protein LOC131051900 n=1 Tax=Cryptomeria japonica TaxID=3369 RepID=UPI0025ACF13B|nr:uncharacterized protein LOC131051900 [Cryptomeria japonica]
MAEKKPDSLARTSFKSKGKPVKVVHIGNPKIVIAIESEFSAVVQSLTGNKRPSAKSATYDSSSFTPKRLNRDCCGSQVKIPMFEDQFKFRPMPNSSPQPPLSHQMPTIRADSVSTSEVQQKEIISDVYNYQTFDTLENLGDAQFFQFLFPYLCDERI